MRNLYGCGPPDFFMITLVKYSLLTIKTIGFVIAVLKKQSNVKVHSYTGQVLMHISFNQVTENNGPTDIRTELPSANHLSMLMKSMRILVLLTRLNYAGELWGVFSQGTLSILTTGLHHKGRGGRRTPRPPQFSPWWLSALYDPRVVDKHKSILIKKQNKCNGRSYHDCEFFPSLNQTFQFPYWQLPVYHSLECGL